jgi:hypothetical protein
MLIFFKQLTQGTEFVDASILMFVAIFSFFQMNFSHLSVNSCRGPDGSKENEI